MCANGPDWWQLAIYFGVTWALAASPWRPASGVLVGAWLVAELYSIYSCNSLPMELYVAADMAVLCAIVRWHTTKLDFAVAAIFPLMWGAYIASSFDFAPTYVIWWVLWALAIVQFALAGPWPKAQRIDGAVSHGRLHHGNS